MDSLVSELIGKVCNFTMSAGFLAEQGVIEAVQDGWLRVRTAAGKCRYLNLRNIVVIDPAPEKTQNKWREKYL